MVQSCRISRPAFSVKVYTDTICEYGYAKELANYGEYSGDPPEEFVYELLGCHSLWWKFNPGDSPELGPPRYAKVILGVMTSSPEPHGMLGTHRLPRFALLRSLPGHATQENPADRGRSCQFY